MNNSRFSNLVIFWTFFIIFLLFNTVSISKNIDLFKGMELYNKNCSSCHMMNLAGKPDWRTGVDEDGQRLPPPLNGTGPHLASFTRAIISNSSVTGTKNLIQIIKARCWVMKILAKMMFGQYLDILNQNGLMK